MKWVHSPSFYRKNSQKNESKFQNDSIYSERGHSFKIKQNTKYTTVKNKKGWTSKMDITNKGLD